MIIMLVLIIYYFYLPFIETENIIEYLDFNGIKISDVNGHGAQCKLNFFYVYLSIVIIIASIAIILCIISIITRRSNKYGLCLGSIAIFMVFITYILILIY